MAIVLFAIENMRIYAHAKINWTLEVLGRRSDGYHEIRTILQTIDLADVLEISKAATLSLDADDSYQPPEDDLIMRAAQQLKLESGYTGGAAIYLQKRIPLAAGLGGGSSDASATLRGLNSLWGLGWSQQQLMKVAASISSDAAFFLHGGTALAEGRGERIVPLPDIPPVDLTLAMPPLTIKEKTARMYGSLNDSYFNEGSLTEQLLLRLRSGEVPRNSDLFNVFQDIAFRNWPELESYRHVFFESGLSQVNLAGSGPALFSITPPEIYDLLVESGPGVDASPLIKTRTSNSTESLRSED